MKPGFASFIAAMVESQFWSPGLDLHHVEWPCPLYCACWRAWLWTAFGMCCVGVGGGAPSASATWFGARDPLLHGHRRLHQLGQGRVLEVVEELEDRLPGLAPFSNMSLSDTSVSRGPSPVCRAASSRRPCRRRSCRPASSVRPSSGSASIRRIAVYAAYAWAQVSVVPECPLCSPAPSLVVAVVPVQQRVVRVVAVGGDLLQLAHAAPGTPGRSGCRTRACRPVTRRASSPGRGPARGTGCW